MKLALLGYGRMGKEVEKIATEKGDEILLKTGSGTSLEEIQEKLAFVDGCIDFSHVNSVPRHLQLCLKAKVPLVIGTTGWDFTSVQETFGAQDSAVLYSPNFSLGMALFHRIADQSAALIASFSNYHLSMKEEHHSEKKDAPSGTALSLKESLLLKSSSIKSLPIESVRAGDNPGRHTIKFQSEEDEITLTHQAYNRRGFASGALTATKWIQGKKGFFTLNDLIEDLL